MEIQQNISLKPFNTMGLEARCRYYAEVSQQKELTVLLRDGRFASVPKFFLGGGSNSLFTDDFKGLVIRLCNKGFEPVCRSAQYVEVRVQAGEVWKDFVAATVENGWWGVENLSGIPGSVGGAAVQNMGAYGREIAQVLQSVEVLDTLSMRFEEIPVVECAYEYRGSRFKRNSRYVVWSVVLKLSLTPEPCLAYAALKKLFENVPSPAQADIAQAVLDMRASKLPDVNEIGSVGSFFTNPVVSAAAYEKLQSQYPDITGHRTDSGVKLSAAWLIDRCGWKSYREGDAGVYPKQPLVLVNYGRATGRDIWNMALRIQQSVKQKFGVNIQPEVCLVPRDMEADR